jgi:hypothetical protein
MSANNIAETSTSTGTGSFTLAGAWSQSGTFNTGNITFNGFYGTNHVFPYMIRDTSGNWESGEGYLSASTTLVRQNVFNNSLGTTAKIDFPSGDKLVFVPTDARSFGSRMLNQVNYVLSSNFYGIRGQITMTANRLYITPHIIQAPVHLTTLAHVIRTAAAGGSTMRVGIYNLIRQPLNGNTYDSNFTLLADLGTVAVDTTGTKAITCDLKLGQGVYGIATISNGAPAIMATGTTAADMWLSANTYEGHPITHWYNDSAPSFTALPANTRVDMPCVMNNSAPQAMFRGNIL